jgi:hypothetical protein
MDDALGAEDEDTLAQEAVDQAIARIAMSAGIPLPAELQGAAAAEGAAGQRTGKLPGQ